jgi:hypothetical protein
MLFHAIDDKVVPHPFPLAEDQSLHAELAGIPGLRPVTSVGTFPAGIVRGFSRRILRVFALSNSCA